MDLTRLLSDDAGATATQLAPSRMDLSRLLNDAPALAATTSEDDDSVANSSPVATPTPSTLVKAETAAKRKRRRPKPAVTSLRAQVEALELALASWSIVLGKTTMSPSTGAISSDTDEHHADQYEAASQRMQDFLRRMVVLYEQSQHEKATREELRRLLKPFGSYQASLGRLLRGAAMSTWNWRCERWLAMGDEFFVPFTRRQCRLRMKELLRFVAAYKFPVDTAEDVLFGWAETRKSMGNEKYSHIASRKTLHARDFHHVSSKFWHVLTTRELIFPSFYQPTTEFFHRVLQVLSPDMVVLQLVEKYAGHDVAFHQVQLAFHVRTHTRNLVVVCPIDSPDLHRVMGTEETYRTSSIYWAQWDAISHDAQGVVDAYTVTSIVHLKGEHPAYIEHWARPSAYTLAIVRTERQLSPESTTASIVLSPN